MFSVEALISFAYLRLIRNLVLYVEHLAHQLSRKNEQSNSKLLLVSENNDEKLQLAPEELLFITNADNYVAVHYRINGAVKQTLLRATLKKIDRQLDHPQVLRCHRSYIVNLTQLVNITGNASGYLLTLRGSDSEIPVSKTYAGEVMRQVENL